MQGVIIRGGVGSDRADLTGSTWKVRRLPLVKSSALRDSVAASGLMNTRFEGMVA